MKKSFSIESALLLFFALTLSCCQTSEKKDADSMDGVWKSLGYGRIVNIEEGEYTLADVTEISCIPLMEGNISDFGDNIKLQNDTIFLKDAINIYHFVRVERAPKICQNDSSEYAEAKAKENDPEYNFEVLWETFKDHYAYFELRNVDPKKMYAEYRPKVTKETTDAELFFVLYEMLESFDDGHIGIEASEEIEIAAQKLHQAKQTAEKVTEEGAIDEPYEQLRNYKVSAEVAKKYIPKGTFIKNGNLRWGILEDNIGYLQINQMMGMADYAISDTLSYREHWMTFFEKSETAENGDADELNGINASLDTIFKDFASTNALIVDVRFNGGGKDELGMAVLTRLNDTERTVFTKKGKMGNGFTPINKVVQTASENPYSNPVYLLIGPESASATEIMALSAMSMKNITRIGSKTEGVFSDILDRSLPNGWEFGLSSEVYLDLDGNNYEGIGISPDVEIGYERDTQKFLQKVMNGLETEGDEAIEKALEIISSL